MEDSGREEEETEDNEMNKWMNELKERNWVLMKERNWMMMK